MNRIIHVNAGKVDARYEARDEYGCRINAVRANTYSGALLQLVEHEEALSDNASADYDIDKIVADYLKHEGGE